MVYKTQSYGNAVSFSINEQNCKVQAQGYVDLIVPANEIVMLKHRSIGDPSPSTMTILPKSGTRHYVRVETNTASILTGAIFGTLGGLTAGMAGTAAATDQGTFIFVKGSEAEARGTRQSAVCR